MVTNPEDYVKEMAASGASQFTFHIESTGASSLTRFAAESDRRLTVLGVSTTAMGLRTSPFRPSPFAENAANLAESIRAVGMRAGVVRRLSHRPASS